MKAMELYDILTLEDNKDYTIANMATYNDSEYLYLIEVDQEENIKEENQKIVRRVIVDGEDSVEIVTEKEELDAVTKIFFELFRDMVDEEEAISEN